MPGLDVLKLLSPEHLAELEVFARHPSRTVDQCHAWIGTKGYASISRSAVYNWKRRSARRDSLEAAAESARAMLAAVKEGGTAAIADVAVLQLGQLIFEKTIALQESGQVKTRELLNLAAAAKSTIEAKRFIERLRAEVDEALRAAEKQKATPTQIMDRVRQILGVPLAGTGN